VVTPRIWKTIYGFTGGHIFHGELALDQIFTMRPVLDWARYQTPVKACSCAARHAPGKWIDGCFRANAAKEIITNCDTLCSQAGLSGALFVLWNESVDSSDREGSFGDGVPHPPRVFL